MNTSRKFLAALALVATGAAIAPARAQDLSASPDVVRATVSGHAYQNGGVSIGDVIDMHRHMQPYDLRLTFSEGKDNAFVANLKLRIVDERGRDVFFLDHAGPLTDVDLPAGNYKVVADMDGVERSGSVEVRPGEPAGLYLHWASDAI